MAQRRRADDDPEYGLPSPSWPSALVLPERPPQLIYLDLNHWIGLGRAQKGNGSQPYIDLLARLRAAIAAGRVRVVLTISLLREVSKIGTPAQRAELTDLMDDLSDFTYLAGLPDIFRLELETALDEITGTKGAEFQPVSLLGRTVLHSLGMVGGLRIMEEGVDVTQELVDSRPGFGEQLAGWERRAERAFLAGPGEDEIPGLRAGGYRPEIPQQQVRDNAAFERQWAEGIDPYRATHHIRDLVIARYLQLELLDMLSHELIARGLLLNQVYKDAGAGRDFALRMPSSAVFISLLAQYHQDPGKQWKQNDIYDIDALATAVPYCDIVLTDAAARDALVRRRLDVTMGTVLPRRPADLIAILNGLSELAPDE